MLVRVEKLKRRLVVDEGVLIRTERKEGRGVPLRHSRPTRTHGT